MLQHEGASSKEKFKAFAVRRCKTCRGWLLGYVDFFATHLRHDSPQYSRPPVSQPCRPHSLLLWFRMMPLFQLDINSKRPERSISLGDRQWRFLAQGSHHPQRQTSSATRAADADLNDRRETHSDKRHQQDEPGAAHTWSNSGSASSSRCRGQTESRRGENQRENVDIGAPELRFVDYGCDVRRTPNGCGCNNHVRRVCLCQYGSWIRKISTFFHCCITGQILAN